MSHRFAYYHHPLDKRYSLEYVGDDPVTFPDEYDQYDPEIVKAIGYSFPRTWAFGLYVDNSISGTTEDLETTEEEITAAIDDMDRDDRPIAVRLLNIYEGVLDEEDRTGDGLTIYKTIEIERTPETINEIDWDGTATEVAGLLMSNFVLKHVLPNANHRCSISMLETYLDFCSVEQGLGFSMPQTHTSEFEWREWVNDYIRRSKRMLTIRRNNIRFDALRGYGCETVVRKDDIEIDLTNWDLDMHYRDAWTWYARKHERLCTEFAEEVADRGGASTLRERGGLDRKRFASLLAERS